MTRNVSGTIAGRLATVGLLAAVQAGAAEDAAVWPGWRGDGSGISREKNPPIHWSADAGVVWKTALPGAGNSSPVVWGDRVFLTAATDGGSNRLVLCIDRNDGKIVWRKDLPTTRVPETHVKNGYASATAVTDGERVYAFFDSPGLVAFDMDGKLLWTRDLGPFKSSYNVASSPVLHGDLVIECCDQEEGSFIVAFDKRTGDERWRTPRKQTSMQFATPVLVPVSGRTQLVVNGQTVIAYDPDSGKELWSCRGMRPNVTPSAVACGDLVYAVSGRNGPAMAISPTGAGDVTETHVRMQVPSGGPYIPSPLAFPDGVLLPGDDGRMRLVGKDGKLLCELRVAGHFTASPTAAGNLIYWPSERGNVAVVRLAGEADAPRLELVAVNEAGGACLASAAIVDGKILLRTDKALLCIGGTAKPAGSTAAMDLPGSFAELKKLYDTHPATDGADAALRLAVVEKLAGMGDAESIALLRTAALKDPQWDVGEAAAKSLATIGQPAIPALIALMGAVDWQPYLKTIAADGLGQLDAAEAVPALLKGANDRNPLVRPPCLQALGRIAAAHPAEADKIIPTLLSSLDDREGMVRKAALDALSLNAERFMTGDKSAEMARKLKAAAADRNPLVEQAAGMALKRFAFVAMKTEAANGRLTDTPRNAPAARWLRAGPVRVKVQDGELRYLCVGDREIVRRIYFAVRDERYDTVMPVFSEAAIEATADSFALRLAAACSNDVAGFSWTGTIAGTADGKITFQVSGQADRDFKPPRIGLNVLYGADALAGQAYELVDAGGKVVTGEFPRMVAAKPLAGDFRTLRYRTVDGLQVSVGLADGTFGMEDQRNFGDSSYKAYSRMGFKPMSVKKGEKDTQTLTLEVKGTPPAADKTNPLRVTLGSVLAGTKLPTFLMTAGRNPAFHEISGKLTGEAAEQAWGFNVAMHMPDDDTFMENATALADQVRTVRAGAPKAKIRIAPVTFVSPYPRPVPDPRMKESFGAAWVVRMVKQLGCMAVDEAGFDVGVAGPAAEMAQELSKFSGSPLLGTVFDGGGIPAPVEVLAVEAGGKRRVWVANLTDQPATAILAGWTAGASVRCERGSAGGRSIEATGQGELALDLAPFEVCRLGW